MPQLVQELEEKLARGEVECMICYEQVRCVFWFFSFGVGLGFW